MINRKASAQWQGNIMEGHGVVSTDSGVLDKTPYSFKTRFEDGKGTNPEELIGAAHAGCFTMAFAALLSQKGFQPSEINTTAMVGLEKTEKGFSIPAIELNMTAIIPHIEEAIFQQLAKEAKENCPVSKLFNAKITLNAKLEN